MAQSIIGGATEYSEQTLVAIQEDIRYWIGYVQKTAAFLADGMQKATESGFWGKVDYDFKLTIITSIEFYKTIVFDLQKIDGAITHDVVTVREVNLLRNIGRKSIQYNSEYGKTYNAEKRQWHDYGNPDFQVVENMYAKGRDCFVSLQDAWNAANRLEDYMQSGNTTNVNFNGNVSDSQIQIGTVNSTQNNSVENSVPYDEILKTVEEINKYRNELTNELKENGDKFCKALDELTKEVKSNGSPTKIRDGIETLKNFVIGIGSSLVASGVLTLLQNIHF